MSEEKKVGSAGSVAIKSLLENPGEFSQKPQPQIEPECGGTPGIPVELTDWNNHMDKLAEVVQAPAGLEVETHTPESSMELLVEMSQKDGLTMRVPVQEQVSGIALHLMSPEEAAAHVRDPSQPEEINWRVHVNDEGQPVGATVTERFANISEVTDVMKGLTSLEQVFPIRTAHPTDPIPGWAKSLIKFFNLAVSDIPFSEVAVLGDLHFPSDLRIFRYAGLDGDQEVTWFRFQVAEQSRTFVVLSKDVPTFLAEMEGEAPMVWTHQRRRSEKGFNLNVTQAPIELPLSFFPFSWDKGPLDDLFDGDFTQVNEVCERLNEDLRTRLAEINRIALKLADLIGQKDHDLYLSFKGVNGLKEMNVALDRVYPKLPESGEIVLGDEPINIFEWSDYSKVVQVNVKRISHGTRQINRMFAKYRALVSPHPAIQELFDTNLKEQLMASSHFLNRVYGFSAAYGVKYMEEVANEIIGKLNAKGGNIGLDLNEWVVYEYHETGRPTPIEDETLDFKQQILNSYTQSFVDALYGYLLDVQNPYIKPYTYREVVEGDDGIEVGTIRQV
jgi:hypothetical protein